MSNINDPILTLFETLSALRRPKLLMQTARHGLAQYDRQRDLRRILRLPAAPAPGHACVETLVALERTHEDRRTRAQDMPGCPWRAAQHVEVLIALLAESALILRPVGAVAARD